VDRGWAHWDILIPPELLTSSSGSPQVDHRPEHLIKISGPEKSEIGTSMKLSMDWFQDVSTSTESGNHWKFLTIEVAAGFVTDITWDQPTSGTSGHQT